MDKIAKRNFYIQEIDRLNEILKNECVVEKLDPFELEEYIKVLDSNFSMVRSLNVEIICDKIFNAVQMRLGMYCVKRNA